jgi:hypothetical protein
MIDLLVAVVIVLVIAGLILSVIPKLGLDPVISNAIYVIVVLIAILLLIGFLPQVGWWHCV